MGKVWNPGAKPETVGGFLRDWCLVEAGRTTRQETLFGAYEMYCRAMRRKDLTVGEFNAEMERRGFEAGERHGAAIWRGVGLAMMEDGLVQREYGARYREE